MFKFWVVTVIGKPFTSGFKLQFDTETFDPIGTAVVLLELELEYGKFYKYWGNIVIQILIKWNSYKVTFETLVLFPFLFQTK